MKRLVFLLLLLSTSGVSAQIILQGTYKEKEVYIQNPYSGNTNHCCTDKVMVNGQSVPFRDEPAFVIHLDSLNLNPGDPVKIEIFHKPDCLPRVLHKTPDHNRRPGLIAFTIDSNALMHIIFSKDCQPPPFIIEQFRWNKWIKTGELVPGQGQAEFVFNAFPCIHSGKNQFRIKQMNDANSTTLSKTIEYLSADDPVTIKPVCSETKIIFSKSTMFELYDSKGDLMTEGSGDEIAISNLRKGRYYLNYDNRMGEFIKH